MVVLRGVLLILFAILLFTNPGLTAISLAIWLAALLIVDGIFTLIGAIMSWKETEDLWFILSVGILSLILWVVLLHAP